MRTELRGGGRYAASHPNQSTSFEDQCGRCGNAAAFTVHSATRDQGALAREAQLRPPTWQAE